MLGSIRRSVRGLLAFKHPAAAHVLTWHSVHEELWDGAADHIETGQAVRGRHDFVTPCLVDVEASRQRERSAVCAPLSRNNTQWLLFILSSDADFEVESPPLLYPIISLPLDELCS
ncbi:MAG: hypothetical protein L0229_30590 [Blastocatellia bacterium]|nr:hypothetical protein [Blastocatellia bacterium]